MRLEFKPQAFEDLQHWVQFQPKIAKRILRMIEETQRDPFGGIGKPEPLKNEYSGWWSKRIGDEHRLVYRIEGEILIILQCRFHYEK
jgi:toxin YoeB